MGNKKRSKTKAEKMVDTVKVDETTVALNGKRRKKGEKKFLRGKKLSGFEMMMARKRKYTETSGGGVKKKKKDAKNVERDMNEKMEEREKTSKEIGKLSKEIKEWEALHNHLPMRLVPFGVARHLRALRRKLNRLKKQSYKN